MAEHSTVTILGVTIHRMTFVKALERIEAFARQKRPHQIVTVNPEFIMLGQTDGAFRRVLNSADLAVPDGAGILWASRFLAGRRPHHPTLTERVTGIDLLFALAEQAAQQGWSVYLLGGLPGVARDAAEKLHQRWPKLKIVGAECGPRLDQAGKPINQDQAALLAKVIVRIQQTQPNFLFVGFGAPKQDRFIAHYKRQLAVPVMIGVGGSFEFIAGRIRRAPRILRVLWLEWLWRLVHQPWRISRIWTAVVRFPLAVWLSR